MALEALLARADAAVTADLARFLKDRDHLVRFTAAQGLRLHGKPEDLSALQNYLERASVGGREAALDAMETICSRHGLALPAEHPGARLVVLPIPQDRAHHVNLLADTALQVKRGDVLVELDRDEVVRSPCDGVIVAIDGPCARPSSIVIRSAAADVEIL